MNLDRGREQYIHVSCFRGHVNSIYLVLEDMWIEYISFMEYS